MKLEHLLSLLADGQFHSGKAISQQLGVSRTTVWKSIAKLEAMGLNIHAVKGRGYRLTDKLDLLSLEGICVNLSEEACAAFDRIDLSLVAESTNRLATQASCAPYVCLAEMQTAGRGRRGRTWVSPFAKNVYLSVAWDFRAASAALDSLSLCIAVAVANALEKIGCEGIGLKWPNDLVIDDHKLAGILLEASGELGGTIRVVAGVGVNVYMQHKDAGGIDQQWTALDRFTRGLPPRNYIVASMLNELAVVLSRFEKEGFVAFQSAWQRFDCLIGRAVELHAGTDVSKGVVKGVDASGALLLETDKGVQAFRGGEISVKGWRDS